MQKLYFPTESTSRLQKRRRLDYILQPLTRYAYPNKIQLKDYSVMRTLWRIEMDYISVREAVQNGKSLSGVFKNYVKKAE